MKRLCLILSTIILFGIVGIASACGGFFCTNTPIDQSAERIIFTINDDNTISAIVGINYEGQAEDFSWVVPVPSPPDLDVAPTNALDVLQDVTNPQFDLPPNYCAGVIWSFMGFGGGGGGYLEQGNVGPYDYATISSDDPAELINWLRDNGYQVTEDMEPIIAEYVIEGMYFLAMKLSNEAEVGDIQPVKMTYQSDKPVIPIRLTAVAALENMPVLVWIFADQPYSPENYVHAQVNFADFRSPSQLREPFTVWDTGFDYMTERNRIQAEHDGKAFITEYAMPSADLLELGMVSEEPYLMDLIESYSFVTRLRAQLSPDQMTLDPSFVPDSQQNHMPNVVDLEEYVDPLHYWGCSNREFEMDSFEETLPELFMVPVYGNDVRVRLPEGWVHSGLNFNEIALSVYAPRTVTSQDLEAYFFEGVSDFPMLAQFTTLSTEWYVGVVYNNLFRLEEAYRLPDSLRVETITFSDLFSNTDDPTMLFALLTTDQDYSENRDVYNAIQSYLRTYEYYAHPELRHTLALADVSYVDNPFGSGPFPPIRVGLPEDWTEFLQENDDVVIVPVDGSSLRVDLVHDNESYGDITTAIWSDDPENNLRALNFTEVEVKEIIKATEVICYTLPVFEYEDEERIGFQSIINGWIATVSSVKSEFEENQQTLRWIAESVHDGWEGCG